MNSSYSETRSLRVLRVASRESKLALWQTNAVMDGLVSLGSQVQLVPLKTSGDIDLKSPIYAMGVTGVFTRELDMALLNNRADLAVHSLKDVPTVLPHGLKIAAVLPRANPHDILVYKPSFDPATHRHAVIATSSIRRRSQWLSSFQDHTIVNVRGNVETRLKKFHDEGWDGIIFARAGLERLGLLPELYMELGWMIPAPSQGAIAVICRDNDPVVESMCRRLNHELSEKRVLAERSFLYHLEGGCSVPVSAIATGDAGAIRFTGAVHSMDGQRVEKVELRGDPADWPSIGATAAAQILESANGRSIVAEFRKLNRTQ